MKKKIRFIAALALTYTTVVWSCRQGAPDFGGRYVRVADDDVFTVADTIVLKRLEDPAGRGYAYARSFRARYKDGVTPDNAAQVSGHTYYDPERKALVSEVSEMVWRIDLKKGLLRSGLNVYTRVPE